MTRKYLWLLPLALLGVGATTYTITQLTSNTSPGSGALLEVYDPAASPKSGKYLLTNLATFAQLSSTALWTNSAGTLKPVTDGVNAALFAPVINVGVGAGTNSASPGSTAIYNVGTLAGSGMKATNSAEIYNLASSGVNATITSVQGFYNFGDNAGREVNATNVNFIYNIGDAAGYLMQLTNSYSINNYGRLSGTGMGASNARDINVYGGGLRNAMLTDSENIVAIGNNAGDGISGAYSNLVLIGTGASVAAATASPQIVMGSAVTLVSLTKAQKTALTPVNGMLLYQSDNTPGLRAYVNGAWVMVSTVADP